MILKEYHFIFIITHRTNIYLWELNSMQLAERLKTCLKIEVLCAEIYHTLGGIFPEARELFDKLAKSEERHADIISISMGFNRINDLPDSFVPSSLEKVTETSNLAEDIKAIIENKRLSLEKSLSMLLRMEQSLAESYLHEIMVKDTDSDVIIFLQQFYNDEKSHAEEIKEFMAEKGYLPS